MLPSMPLWPEPSGVRVLRVIGPGVRLRVGGFRILLTVLSSEVPIGLGFRIDFAGCRPS